MRVNNVLCKIEVKKKKYTKIIYNNGLLFTLTLNNSCVNYN